MAKLDPKMAGGLAAMMSKNGIPGTVSKDKPNDHPDQTGKNPLKSKKPAFGEDDGQDDTTDEPMDELGHCVHDVAHAVAGGDVDTIKSALHNLMDMVKGDKKEEDAEGE